MAAPAKNNWVPPLPPGWEGRWDPNQKAYFFINHSNRSTTWEDPRWQKPAQPQPNAWTQSDSSHLGLPSGDDRHGNQSGEAIPMADLSGSAMRGAASYEQRHRKKDTGFTIPSQADINALYIQFKLCPKDVVKAALSRNNNNKEEAAKDLVTKGYRQVAPVVTASPQQLNTAPTPLDKLKAMFPGVPKDVVQDMFAACENNEASTIKLLEELGFKRSGADSSSSTPSRSAASPQHQPSTSGASASTSPKRSLTHIEKEKVKKKFLAEFQALDKDLVRMAVETCEYEEETIRHVLEVEVANKKTANARPKKSPARSAGAENDRAAVPTPSPASPPLAASFDPVILASSDSTPAPTPTDATNKQSKGKKKDGKGKAPASQTATPTRSPAPRPSQEQQLQQQQQQQRAKQVTRTPATAAAPPSTVVTHQPWKSEYLTKPIGPDPDLRQGPDQSLLLTSYTPVLGPNPEYHCGPDHSRVQGPQGAVGADPSLHCGPQSRKGASHLMPHSRQLLISET